MKNTVFGGFITPCSAKTAAFNNTCPIIYNGHMVNNNNIFD